MRAKERAARRARAAGARGLEPSRGAAGEASFRGGRCRSDERRREKERREEKRLGRVSSSSRSLVRATFLRPRGGEARGAGRSVCLLENYVGAYAEERLTKEDFQNCDREILKRKIVSAGDRERQPCKKQPIARCRARARDTVSAPAPSPKVVNSRSRSLSSARSGRRLPRLPAFLPPLHLTASRPPRTPRASRRGCGRPWCSAGSR